MMLIAPFWLRESEISNDVDLRSLNSHWLVAIESLLAITLLYSWTHPTSLLFQLHALKAKSIRCSQKFFLVRLNKLICSSFLLSTTHLTCTLLKLTYGIREQVRAVCMGFSRLLVTSERWKSKLFCTEGTSEHLIPQRCACYVVLEEILQGSGQKLGRIARSRDNFLGWPLSPVTLTTSRVEASCNTA